MIRHLVVSLTALGCLAAPAVAQRAASHPDATQAEIDGRVAVGLWASDGGKLLDAGLFTVRLVDDNLLEKELAYPAGHWFQPPVGRYRMWIEGDGQVSPSFSLLQFAGAPFRGRGLAGVTEVVPAGEVILHPDLALTDDLSVRVLQIVGPSRGEERDRGFMRSIPRERAERPVVMPVGRAVGLLYDQRKGKYLAASRPFDVTPKQRARVLPEVRASTTDVFVILHRSEPIRRAADDDLSLGLAEEGRGQRPPDLMVPTWEWVYALWYAVEGKTAHLESASDSVFLEATDIGLDPGGVATFRGELRPCPFLEVRIELPEEIEPAGMVLEILSVEEGRGLFTRELSPDTLATRIEGLPAADLHASLTIRADPGWTLGQRIDLRDGSGREIVFRPEPLFLRGTLYHGDEPAVGEIRIATDQTRQRNSWLVAETDAEGRYEATLYSPGLYIMYARLSDTPGPDFKVRSPRIRHDAVIDIHIPRTAVIVRVEDSETGVPVENALVIYDNYFDDKEDTRERNVNISSNTRTDEEGSAHLAPPRPGKLIVWVEKEDYYRSPGVERTILESENELEIVVRLDPVSEARTLRLRLPGGGPAAGAEVRAQYVGWNEPPVWEGRADAKGRVEVPARAETGWLLIRHPGAGAWVEPWIPEGRETLELRLPATPPNPLALRSVDSGGEIVPWRPVTVRVGGTWVAGNSLAWLTGAPVAATGARGIWEITGLPADEILVAAGSHETIQLALQGLVDGSACRVRPPWPSEPVEVVTDAP